MPVDTISEGLDQIDGLDKKTFGLVRSTDVSLGEVLQLESETNFSPATVGSHEKVEHLTMALVQNHQKVFSQVVVDRL